MKYLLDVNVLVAWGWSDHVGHERAASWIGEMKRKRGVNLLTSPITELGFVRVSLQRTRGGLAVSDAVDTLASMIRSLGQRHRFLADGRSSIDGFPVWCSNASKTTDAHLFSLAHDNGAQLATLDADIPDAFLIPAAQMR